MTNTTLPIEQTEAFTKYVAEFLDYFKDIPEDKGSFLTDCLSVMWRYGWQASRAAQPVPQVQKIGKSLSRYGPQCCHKTVLSRCKGCPYDVAPPALREAIPASQDHPVGSAKEFFAEARRHGWQISEAVRKHLLRDDAPTFAYAYPASQPPAVQGGPAGYKLLKDTTYEERSYADAHTIRKTCLTYDRDFCCPDQYRICKVCIAAPQPGEQV